MSFKWPIKDPDETLDYSVDWSRFLGSGTISFGIWLYKHQRLVRHRLMLDRR